LRNMSAPVDTEILGQQDRLRPWAGAVKRPLETLGLVRYSAVYGLVAIIIIFWLALPHSHWISSLNLKIILSESGVNGLFALAALVPLSAGMLDLQFANVGGLGLVLTSWIALSTSIPDALIILIVVMASALAGLISALVIVRFSLSSLLVTLGMSSVVLAVTQIILNGRVLYPTSHFSKWFLKMSTGYLGPFQIPVLILLGLGLIVHIWMEHTPSGRHLLATGANPVAARLAGVNVNRLSIISLMFSSALGGFTGLLLAGILGTADDVTVPLYLLPAIAALFLGTTQGKFRLSVVGTLLAVAVLQTADHGFELAGSTTWVEYVFTGGILLIAVTVSRGRTHLAV
jgi:ribose transport system permease protein